MSPRRVGHLVELPLTTGRRVLIDPSNVAEVSSHNSDGGVTVIRCREQRFLFHINATYETVVGWLAPVT